MNTASDAPVGTPSTPVGTPSTPVGTPTLPDSKTTTRITSTSVTSIEPFVPPAFMALYNKQQAMISSVKDDPSAAYILRKKVNMSIGWGQLSVELIKQLHITGLLDCHILSVGAGAACNEKAIQETINAAGLSGSIIATDIASSTSHVERLSALDAIKKYPNIDVLMFIWPSYDESWSYQALKEYTGMAHSSSKYVVYIGEDRDGCTGCIPFHDMLYTHYEPIIEPARDPHRWWGIHDYIHIYKRRASPVKLEVKPKELTKQEMIELLASVCAGLSGMSSAN